mmetsp:Transcript_17894/g.40560  ORF Transcript_17894/g.40560 Transcript_17894/m.40560 type:complete len:225 (+) Transcript_17894:139-813(+)
MRSDEGKHRDVAGGTGAVCVEDWKGSDQGLKLWSLLPGLSRRGPVVVSCPGRRVLADFAALLQHLTVVSLKDLADDMLRVPESCDDIGHGLPASARSRYVVLVESRVHARPQSISCLDHRVHLISDRRRLVHLRVQGAVRCIDFILPERMVRVTDSSRHQRCFRAEGECLGRQVRCILTVEGEEVLPCNSLHAPASSHLPLPTSILGLRRCFRTGLHLHRGRDF